MSIEGKSKLIEGLKVLISLIESDEIDGIFCVYLKQEYFGLIQNVTQICFPTLLGTIEIAKNQVMKDYSVNNVPINDSTKNH